MTKLLQQCFLFFIVVVILGHNLGNSQVSVYRTIGPTLVFPFYQHVMVFSSDFFQVAVIYMCTRLVVNVSQVYLPMYITETIKLDKV